MKIGLNTKFLGAFVLLFSIIVLIAVFGGSGFIRYHFGDILIVILIYCFFKMFIVNRLRFLPLFIFIFAICVEILQYFGLVYILGLGDVTIARIIIGTTFDPWDILMYFIGFLLILLFEKVYYKNIE